MFYDKFKFLCDSIGVSCNKAAVAMDLSNATPTKWKKTGATPDSSTLAKVASYFHVPIAFFLDSPPYDCWAAINEDRKRFLQNLNADFELIDMAWDIDVDNPDATPTKDFIQFLGEVVEYARPDEDGRWTIAVRPGYQKKEKAPTPKGERKPDVEDLKLALFGGDGEVTDEMWEEALFAAEMIKARYKRKKAQDE